MLDTSRVHSKLDYRLAPARGNLHSNIVNQDFIGIKLGDVNNSWNPAIPKRAAIGEVYLDIDKYQTKSDDEITVPIKVKDFENILGYQFTIDWRESVA